MRTLAKNRKLLFYLFLLTVIGGFFRFYNLNWDNGNFFHPDERNIANAVSRIRFFSQLNPDFFAYGGFLIYLYRATGEILVRITNNANWVYDWGHINIIGRFYSALFSTITIPLIFFLANNIFNKKVAVISALITAFTASFIQTSHFGITENFLVLISLLTCLSAIKMLKTGKLKYYILSAFLVGLGAATKTTALSLIIFPLAAHILNITKLPYNFVKRIYSIMIFMIIGFSVFTIFSPYTFLRWEKFMESMRYESGVALGALPVPYTLQFTNTTPYSFQIKNFLWQMSPISYFLIPAFILAVLNIIKTKNHKLILFLSFPLIYFLYVGHWHTKFIRFMLPTMPFIIILISYFLLELRKKTKALGKLLLIISIFPAIIWGLAFFSIYTKEQTRITASRWIYANIPSNSKLLGEHWDDGLPITIGSSYPSKYNIKQLTIYEPDNNEKVNYYADKLSNADYLIINSRRLYGTLINLPDKYPITSRYYKLLFANKLGYEKVAEFSSYPSIFGIDINDDQSEETFQVYDHPKVIVFKNGSRYSSQAIKEILK